MNTEKNRQFTIKCDREPDFTFVGTKLSTTVDIISDTEKEEHVFYKGINGKFICQKVHQNIGKQSTYDVNICNDIKEVAEFFGYI